MPFLDLPLARVHYLDLPPAAAPVGTLVLLHGFTCDHRLMSGAFEPVLERHPGWRRVYLDLPGHGRSTATAALRGTDDVFAVVQEAVRQLVPEGPLALAGESYGGYLTQGLLTADSGRYAGACLVAPAVLAAFAERKVPEHQVIARQLDEIEIDPESAHALGVVQTPETFRRTAIEVQTGIDSADPAVIARISADYRGAWEGSVPLFDRPGLVVTGRQDAAVGYADQFALTAGWPRTTYAALDRAGHNVQIDQAAVFDALVGDWLARVTESLDVATGSTGDSSRNRQ
ncbi:alpha/beta fold hydrolase [Flexivirga meconopsidis]|uniref:alpha/beta fold hydrolase n=1 Tax=Flexivirga meconopsidis TaxID=2977121 RepID=UPI002240E19D|nr:alpha/beta hydrolase [Flexivirga meconopsidis]